MSTKEAMNFKEKSYNRLIANQELVKCNFIPLKKAGEMIVAFKPGSNSRYANSKIESINNASILESTINRNNTSVISKVKPSSSFQKLTFALNNFSNSSKKIASDCDTIVLIDGSKKYGKVMKVDRKNISYQNCNDPNGPNYTYQRANVKEIKYANGYIEKISHNTSYRMMNLGGLWFTLLIFSIALYVFASATVYGIGAVILLLLSALAAIAFLVYYICWLLKIMDIIKPE